MRESPSPERPRTPRLSLPRKWVIGVGAVVLAVGLANLARGGLTITYSTRLPDLEMSVSWEYLAATSIFWGLALVVSSICLAGFYRWARWATLGVATLYQVHAWVNHLLFDANEYARQTWPRDLILTAVFLALVWGILSWPSVRREFEG